jgi:hypothetical protein
VLKYWRFSIWFCVMRERQTKVRVKNRLAFWACNNWSLITVRYSQRHNILNTYLCTYICKMYQTDEEIIIFIVTVTRNFTYTQTLTFAKKGKCHPLRKKTTSWTLWFVYSHSSRKQGNKPCTHINTHSRDKNLIKLRHLIDWFLLCTLDC